MEHPLSSKKRHDEQRVPENELMRQCEDEAVDLFIHRFNEEGKYADLEERFIEAVRKSPSLFTIDYGISFSIEAEWPKALEALLTIDLTAYKCWHGNRPLV